MKIEGNSNYNNRIIPNEVKKFAKEMEQEFNKIMLSEMEKTVELEDDMVSEYYRSIMRDEQAKILSEANGGLGIGKLILDSLYPSSVNVNAKTNTNINNNTDANTPRRNYE